MLHFYHYTHIYVRRSLRNTIPVWITSVVISCSESNVCFQACYSVNNIPVDMQSVCPHTKDVIIACGMYVL